MENSEETTKVEMVPPFNVWEIKRIFEETSKFPKMSNEEKESFLRFAKYQVDDTIEAYERHTYSHGGLGEDAKKIFDEIQKAEKLYKEFKKEVEN